MNRADVGALRSAGVSVLDGEVVLLIKGEHGTVSVCVPEDMAEPFLDTVREAVRVYDPDATPPSDGLDTTFREEEYSNE